MFLAHTAHWLVWVLYTIPVFAVLAAVVVASVRARKLAESDDAATAPLDSGSETRA
jgi:cytochrome c-type biogenesis protein CcmH/NrfF